MIKSFPLLAVGVAMLAGAAVVDPMPVIAQTTSSEVTVYGADPCPRDADATQVVCVRRPEEERYRIPKALRRSGPPQKRNSWVNQSRVFSRQGLTGPQSCSAVGPAGYTGCSMQELHDYETQRAADVGNDTPSK